MSSAPSYHAMSRSERDFLVAVSGTPADASGKALTDYVESLHGGERPSNTTTYNTLARLVEWGLVCKADADGVADAYQLTEAGYQTLRDGAAEITP